MNDLATNFEPNTFVDLKGDIDLLRIYSKNKETLTALGSFPYLDATTSEGEKNDDLQRPPLPEEELPEDDDSEQTGGGADSPTGSQPQAMPGWFKLALVVALIILLSVGYVGYLYLRGELSFGDTAGGSVTGTPPTVQAPSIAGSRQTTPDQESSSNTIDSQDTASRQRKQPSEDSLEAESEGYAIREAVEPGLPRLNLSRAGEKAAAGTNAPTSSPSPSVEEPGAQDGSPAQQQGQQRPSQVSLSGIESSLNTIEDMLRDHQDELVRLSSLIANNELTLKQQAEDLASLSSRLAKVISSQTTPKNPPSSRTPELSIALLSVRQMGEALGVSVRYLGSTQRLLLGQAIDGWRLTDVHMEQRSARFTHSATGRTVTVSL